MEFYLENYEVLNVKEKLNHKMKSADITKIRNLWEEGYTRKGVTVAIIDSGIDINHPNFFGRIIKTVNFTSDNNDIDDVFDYSGHGTHVAGTIGSINTKNVEIGVAPNVNFVILKVINKNGRGNVSDVIKALEYCYEWNKQQKKKIDIINLSLGSPTYNEDLYKIIKKLDRQDTFIVSAAGNYGDSNKDTQEIIYPGFFQEVIQIGSTNNDNNISEFTNTNLNIDFIAPGEAIYSTFPNSSFATLSGTSMAAPLVSGGIALLLEKISPTCNHRNSEINLFLKNNSIEIDAGISEQGNGLIVFYKY